MTTTPVVEPSAQVFRIHWVPGTDRLLAVCFCTAERIFEDPVELWDWLLAHPDHPAGPPPADGPGHPAGPTQGRAT